MATTEEGAAEMAAKLSLLSLAVSAKVAEAVALQKLAV